MGVRLMLPAALACCVLSLRGSIIPGEAAPDLLVRDASGKTVNLAGYREKKHVALLFLSPDRVVAADWANTVSRLAVLETVPLFVDGSPGTMLIDDKGIVRRVLTGRVLTGTELENFVELWQTGKGAYIAYCARCHGDDGDAIWCDPKPLTGVGQRLSVEQVRQKLNAAVLNDQVIIRGELIKRSDMEAVIIYIRSL